MDLSSYFDKIEGSEAGNTNSSLKYILIDSQTNEDNKSKITTNLPLKHFFWLLKKIFTKITNGLGFELQLKTSNEKQNIISTTLRGNDAKMLM